MLQEVQSHAIDPIKILKDDKKLSVLTTICESCFLEGEKRNTTSTEEDNGAIRIPNLNLERKPIFHGIGKIAFKNEEEMFDEEGTPIDAEVTIVIKLNQNSNSNKVVKKLILGNFENIEKNLKQDFANLVNLKEMKEKHE